MKGKDGWSGNKRSNQCLWLIRKMVILFVISSFHPW